MANNYYEATGVLVLDRVTPVIQALFGAFALDESHPGNGQAYIAQIAETTNPAMAGRARWPGRPGHATRHSDAGRRRAFDPPLLELLAVHFRCR